MSLGTAPFADKGARGAICRCGLADTAGAGGQTSTRTGHNVPVMKGRV